MSEQDTKTRIMDAAQVLIQRFGSNGMSYSDISEAVGIRKASIHYYFPTKESLLEALIERYSTYFFGLVDEIIAGSGDARDKLRRYISLFEATLCEDVHHKACLCGMLGAELASLNSASVAGIRNFYDENEKRLSAILDQGRKEGSLSFSGESRPTAALLFASLEGGVLIARAQDGVNYFRYLTDQLIKLLTP